MKQKSAILYFVIFTVIAIVSVIILHHAKNTTPHKNTDILDSFVSQANYVSYNKQGQLHTKIIATQVRHYKHKKTAYFTKPQMLTYTEDRTPWYIEANNAKSSDNMTHVFLWGDVVVHKLSDNKKPDSTIKTTTLTVLPKQSVANTSDEVTIYRHGSVLHGRGLIANLKTGKYELVSHSAGFYLPVNK